MNDPTRAGTPPSAEGILTRPSPFSVEETFERLQEAIHSRILILFAYIDHSGEARRVCNIAVVDALIEQALQG